MSRRLFPGQLADSIAGEDRPRAERLRRLARELVGVVRHGLIRDGQVRIHGFGTFRLSPTKARKGINPRTGERIDIPARYRVLFRPAKALRERIEPGWAPAVALAEPHASREAVLGGVMSEAPAAGTLPAADEERHRPTYFPDRIAAAAMADTVVRTSEPVEGYRPPASGSREANLGGTMGTTPSAGRVPPRPDDRQPEAGAAGAAAHGRAAANEEEPAAVGRGSREAELGSAATTATGATAAPAGARSPREGTGARAEPDTHAAEPPGRGSRESTLADGSAASRAAGGLPEEDLPWEQEPSGESRHRTVPSTREGPPRPPLDETGPVAPEGSREAVLGGRVTAATPAGGGLPPEERPDAETSVDWVAEAEPEPAPQPKVIIDDSLEPREPAAAEERRDEERQWAPALLLLLLALLLGALAWWFWPRPEVPVAGTSADGVMAEAEPGAIERGGEGAAASESAGTAAPADEAEAQEPAAETGAADTGTAAAGSGTAETAAGEPATATAETADQGAGTPETGATGDGAGAAATEAAEATAAAGPADSAETGSAQAPDPAAGVTDTAGAGDAADAGLATDATDAAAAAATEGAGTTAGAATRTEEAMAAADTGAGTADMPSADTAAGGAAETGDAAATAAAEPATGTEQAAAGAAADSGGPWFAGRAYSVRRGDTLWDLSDERYVNPYYWPHIWNHNGGIANPDVIEIDQRLWLPTLEGEPRSLTAADRRSIAEGYLRLYHLWQGSGAGNPQYALVGVRYFDASVMPPELRGDPSAGRPSDALAAAFAALLEAEFPRQR